MFFNVTVVDSHVLGVIGSDRAVYWQTECIGTFLGYKSMAYFVNAKSTHNVKDVCKRMDMFRKCTLQKTYLMDQEAVLKVLRKTKRAPAKSLLEILDDGVCCIQYAQEFRDNLKTDYKVPFLKACLPTLPGATRFTDWIREYTNSVMIYPEPKPELIESNSPARMLPPPPSASQEAYSPTSPLPAPPSSILRRLLSQEAYSPTSPLPCPASEINSTTSPINGYSATSPINGPTSPLPYSAIDNGYSPTSPINGYSTTSPINGYSPTSPLPYSAIDNGYSPTSPLPYPASENSAADNGPVTWGSDPTSPPSIDPFVISFDALPPGRITFRQGYNIYNYVLNN